MADAEAGLLEQRLDTAASEELKVRAVEQTGGFVSPVAGQQGADEAVVAGVGQAGHHAAAGPQPVAHAPQQMHRPPQVFQHVAADDGVEGRLARLVCHRFDVTDKDAVEALLGGGTGVRIALDADDHGGLSRLEGFAELAGAAADVENAACRLRNKGEDFRPGVLEIVADTAPGSEDSTRGYLPRRRGGFGNVAPGGVFGTRGGVPWVAWGRPTRRRG